MCMKPSVRVCSKKRNTTQDGQSPARDLSSGAFTDHQYQELELSAVSTPVYDKIQKPAPSSSPAAAAAISATVYNNTTTLVDNALYDVQQPPVTSSNVAETDDDVTDLTVIDNDLYEREGQGQGQQNAGSTDYECTLIDNDLYR